VALAQIRAAFTSDNVGDRRTFSSIRWRRPDEYHVSAQFGLDANRYRVRTVT